MFPYCGWEIDAGRRLLRPIVLAAVASFYCCQALAEVDCDQLRKTNIPFQLSFDIAPNVFILRNTSQVFRQPGNSEFSYRFNIGTSDTVLKHTSQYGMPIKLTSVLPDDKIYLAYKYDRDIAQLSLLDKRDKVYRAIADYRYKQPSQHAKYTFLKEDTMVVGACSFSTLNYHVEVTVDDPEYFPTTVIDVAWSPELQAALWSKGTIGQRFKSGPTQYFFTAKAITTDFQRVTDK